MLLSFVLCVTPGSALMFFIVRFIKANQTVSVARTETVRARARMEGAQRASAVAEGTAREAMSQTGQALEIARTIELVDEKVTSLTDYLVTKIEGEAPSRRSGRHALPRAQDVPAVAGGAQEGILP